MATIRSRITALEIAKGAAPAVTYRMDFSRLSDEDLDRAIELLKKADCGRGAAVVRVEALRAALTPAELADLERIHSFIDLIPEPPAARQERRHGVL